MTTYEPICPYSKVTISQGRAVEQKRELVHTLTREAGRILKTREQPIHDLIHEVSKENRGDANMLGFDMM